MCQLLAFQSDADFIQFVVDQVEEYIDTDAGTWNKSAGVMQFAGEAVRWSKGPDLLTVVVRGQEVLRLR